jgi:beta-phosphoglucomutase-like phosphatase (HAD superfamily)
MITLNEQPTACAIVAKSAAVADAARSTGAATIGYAPAHRENLATTHPEAIVASLADLVLRLRSRLLPN